MSGTIYGRASPAPSSRLRRSSARTTPYIVADAAGAGETVDLAEGRNGRERVSAAMAILRAATPGTGSYVNETDYFEPDWQSSFWGANYARLLSIKHTYDPNGLFTCHHCVGSEER